jgi:hypothetical protein
MGASKREWDRSHPTLTCGGTSTAITLTPATAIAAYVTGQMFAGVLAHTLGASATLNVSGKGAKKVYLVSRTGLFQPLGGEAVTGQALFFYYDATLDAASGGFVVWAGLPQQPITESIGLSVTSETGLVAAGTGLVTFRMPYNFTVTEVRASLQTAQASGNILTIDINEGGVTILSTKLTIDNTEKTSTTAATPPVISDTALGSGNEITVDVDQIGNGTAAGLKVYLIGRQT